MTIPTYKKNVLKPIVMYKIAASLKKNLLSLLEDDYHFQKQDTNNESKSNTHKDRI